MTDISEATFAAGCFWGVQEAFAQQPGVLETKVGYTGGHTQNPNYKTVCSGETGHAEAVHLIFDATKTSYEALLRLFWSIHNPTTLNRQGPDVGSQYRSAVFFHTEEQRQLATDMKASLEDSKQFSNPIVTEIASAGDFFLAEDYHQHYLAKQKLK